MAKMTPEARMTALNDSRTALAKAFDAQALSTADKAVTAEVKAGDKTRRAMFAFVQAAQDLGVPARDTGVTKMIQTVIKEHADEVFGPMRPESGEPLRARVMWEDWSKVIQRAVYHGVGFDQFRISLKNDPEFKIDGKAQAERAGKTGKVESTTLYDYFVTVSKALRQARMLNLETEAADLLDLILDRHPEFKELGDDGKPVSK